MSPHNVEHSLQICKMIAFVATFHCNIIDVAFYSLACMLVEVFVHGMLICQTCILQAKGYHDAVVHSQRCSEGCMFLIFWIHLDLIISWEAVHEGHSPKYARIVNHDIRNWERKPVFGTSDIQIVKVNADPDLLIFLWDGHDIGYPLRLLFFPNEKESY